MITKTYPVGTLPAYKYVVVLSEYQGKILLSRHKKRTTWETQGGKIEPGETPLMATIGRERCRPKKKEMDVSFLQR